jgi:hypothetical protein
VIAVLLLALDVVDPPKWCPPGKTAITGHGGSVCVENPPKNCPPGWHGVLGGQCKLHPCKSDADCDGEECVEHAVCLRAVMDDFYEYNEPRDSRLEKTERTPFVFTSPPMPRERRPKPIARYEALNLCAPDARCPAPGLCQKEKICVPRGQRAKAYLGTNIAPARVARTTETPLTAPEATESETSAPLKKGCGSGCSIAFAAVFFATRRRR